MPLITRLPGGGLVINGMARPKERSPLFYLKERLLSAKNLKMTSQI
jgi:hypothetical protein